MRAETRRAGRLLTAALTAATLAGGADAARAATFQVVYSFNGPTDGGNPSTPKLAVDPSGAVYGSAATGGPGGKGTVWKLRPVVGRGGVPVWTLSVLHAFKGSDGQAPYEVQRDSSGTLFVATASQLPGEARIWTIAPTTHVLSLVAATAPELDFTFAGSGQVVGVTGGGLAGFGALFQVTQSNGTWAAQTLHNFSVQDAAGYHPNWVTTGPDGTVYGTTRADTIFEKLSSSKALIRLAALHASPDQLQGVTPDGQGGLYGVLDQRGDASATVFRWQPGRAGIQTFHTFPLSTGGPGLLYPPVPGADGALYGTARVAPSEGMVYRLTLDGQFTVVHAFTGGTDGGQPATTLVQGMGGYLYGTTRLGGAHSQGTVFRVHP